jgi:tetratricopeptide (TPR) repeat protein
MRIIIIIIVILFIFSILNSSNINEFVRINQFANELMRAGDYQRAITEYKKIISYFPTDRNILNKSFLIARCYELDEQYREVIDTYEGILEFDSKNWFSIYRTARLYHQTSQYSESNNHIKKYLPGIESIQQDSLYLISAYNYINLHKYDLARENFGFIRNEELRGKAVKDRETMDYSLPLQYRSRDGAVILGLIPGGGYFYTSEYELGLITFFLVGLLGYATYDSFDQGNVGCGIISGLLTGGVYIGSIYGAVKYVESYNKQIEISFTKKFKL